MPHLAYIALGSNLGDRRATLDSAVAALRERPGLRVVRWSSWIETEAVGGPAGNPTFLNGAAEIETELPPRALLAVLQEIEDRFGRARGEANGPRTLDLDLLLYEDRVIDEPGLVVPHPRMSGRRFVLEPLAEIAPAASDPVSGRTVAELLESLRSGG